MSTQSQRHTGLIVHSTLGTGFMTMHKEWVLNKAHRNNLISVTQRTKPAHQKQYSTIHSALVYFLEQTRQPVPLCGLATRPPNTVLTSSVGRRRSRRLSQGTTIDLAEIPQMRSDIWNVYGGGVICIEARLWVQIAGSHHLLVVVVLVNVIDSHWDVVPRRDVPLRPDVVVAEGRQSFDWQTGHGIVDVGYAEVATHSLSGNVPSEEVISNSR